MLANVLVRQCLVMTNGVGGFVTYGLLGLVDYSLQIPSNYFDNPFRKTTVSQVEGSVLKPAVIL